MDMQYNIIRGKNNLRLVQYENEDGIQCRSWMTVDAINNQVDPSEGIPASMDFSQFVNFQHPSPTDFDAELKRRGVWTTSELIAEPNTVINVLQTLYGPTMASVLQKAQKFEKESK